MELKKCAICLIEKSTSEFYKFKDNRNKGGKGIYLKYLCKSCDKKNGLKQKEKSRRIKRAYIWQYKKENPCIDCGEANPICLQFDHIKPKFMDVGIMAAGGHSIKKLKNEINKCVIRCANCHLKKTALEQGWYKEELAQEDCSLEDWNKKFNI